MLTIVIPAMEDGWDEEKQEFVTAKEQTLHLEHSLISLSKWEAKWHKVFVGNKDLSLEETIDYIRCMTITPNVDPAVYYRLTSENVDQILAYIDDPMSATNLPKGKEGSAPSREPITSELLYCSMIMLQIPVEFEKWHLNRLITLIRLIQLKTTPRKKMSKGEIMRRNSALNAARRKRLNSKG